MRKELVSPRRRACILLAFVLVLLAPTRAHSQEVQPARPPAELEYFARAAERCDWNAIVEGERELLAIATEIGPAWLEARYVLASALQEVWKPPRLRALVEETLGAVVVHWRTSPDPRVCALRPDDPGVLSRTFYMELQLMKVLQGEGAQLEALAHARSVFDEVQRTPTQGRDALLQRALLGAGRSLLALGREAEARGALESLRDSFPGTQQAAIAIVLLEGDGSDLDAYRGKYADDPAHRLRMQELFASVKRARKRLASRLGCKDSELPRVHVGVADQPESTGLVSAITFVDPRVPAFAPVVIYFSEDLSLGYDDPERVLVHELSHAVLGKQCGLEYERMPAWLTEGISQALAEQFDGNAEGLLATWLARDPPGFASDDWWIRHPLRFDSGACGSSHAPESGIALLYLLQKAGIDGVRQLVKALSSGSSWAAALERASGLDPERYLEAARTAALAHLEARRQASLAQIRGLLGVGARASSGQASLDAVLAALDAAGRSENAPLLRGLALWQRALVLERAGRAAEGLAAFEALYAERRTLSSYVEFASMGRARCLRMLGRDDEARAACAALARDALTESTRGEAQAMLGELTRGDTK